MIEDGTALYHASGQVYVTALRLPTLSSRKNTIHIRHLKYYKSRPYPREIISCLPPLSLIMLCVVNSVVMCQCGVVYNYDDAKVEQAVVAAHGLFLFRRILLTQDDNRQQRLHSLRLHRPKLPGGLEDTRQVSFQLETIRHHPPSYPCTETE